MTVVGACSQNRVADFHCSDFHPYWENRILLPSEPSKAADRRIIPHGSFKFQGTQFRRQQLPPYDHTVPPERSGHSHIL
ncbi:MAG: hypothetical protein C4K48_13045 [Candidatus Thorarchaeota archaeon]|nr:MAG: hypothetical protein C4K48_13045 [Candidatus Thorarchaeota archaeon]